MPRDPRTSRSPRGRASTSRPSSSRPTAGRGSRDGRTVRRPAASAGRALRSRRNPRSMRRLTIFGALVVFLAVLITPTLRSFLHSQSEIDGLRTQLTAQGADVRSMQAQQKRWDDPAYVKQQAAKRLGFAAPGGTITVLVNPKAPTSKSTGSPVVGADTDSSTHPWYGQLWQSLVRSPPK